MWDGGGLTSGVVEDSGSGSSAGFWFRGFTGGLVCDVGDSEE